VGELAPVYGSPRYSFVSTELGNVHDAILVAVVAAAGRVISRSYLFVKSVVHEGDPSMHRANIKEILMIHLFII